MSADSLRRMWEQQDELQKLIGTDQSTDQPKQRRRCLPEPVRRQIGESLRKRWASRRREPL